MSASTVELGFLDDFWVPGTYFSSTVELGFEDDFWDNKDSVFVNGLSMKSILFAQKMSASAVELGFLDDYLVPRVLVFINVF